ncbi:polyprenyl synthetase family protein [Lacisediminihabitans changchengi]|uniref:Polyprenyl synthetase family protein n=1 Tax=Lacisediminihabitans changchengi TaxID=2787634 RepID=A0A934W3B7_9MICO|nr:polyprenyl synthetase family protein [Lacisediminihabitans changchengi]MBK4347746.1 polyprenyl synthetase family protein [Lacisediminihabitans changchengi]
MAESTRLVDLVQAGLDAFLDDREPMLLSVSPDLAPFIDYTRDLLQGGKRFRALFCYWGWQAVSGVRTEDRLDFDPIADPTSSDDLHAVVLAASALEIFHAAALVHDDIMDNSDTRRGRPAAHRRFETLHYDSRWSGSPRGFGQSAALLLGDLLLGWSDELFDSGIQLLAAPDVRDAARTEFNTMRTQVTVGQYLDILEERAWNSFPEGDQLSRAHRVIVYKSAKYSIEAPLAIGALLGGASPSQVTALRDFGLPLGIAFQLRDDLLGVFGDPETTGKPAGDDLREGKRTVLIAIARAALPANASSLLDELLGDAELSVQQVRMLQASIRDCGAVDEVERVIEHNVRVALAAIEDAPISAAAKRQLVQLADTVAQRVS